MYGRLHIWRSAEQHNVESMMKAFIFSITNLKGTSLHVSWAFVILENPFFISVFTYNFIPCFPAGFSQTYFLKGVLDTPLQIINNEGHLTLNLRPV